MTLGDTLMRAADRAHGSQGVHMGRAMFISVNLRRVCAGSLTLGELRIAADDVITCVTRSRTLEENSGVPGRLNEVAAVLLRDDVEAFEWAAWRSARRGAGWPRRRVVVMAVALDIHQEE